MDEGAGELFLAEKSSPRPLKFPHPLQKTLKGHRVVSTYSDDWDGDTLLYTGMGQKGDQSLTFAQNKTLAESNSNGVTVHLCAKSILIVGW